MGTAAYGNFWQRQQAADNARDTEMGDALRQQKISQFGAVQQNIQKILASGIDPHTQAPLTDENKAALQNVYNTVSSHMNDLYNPKFNPATNEVPEDPLHRLTTTLHITKDTHPAPGQQVNDLNAILTKYGTEAEVNPLQKQARIMTESGAFTPEEVKKAQRIGAGIEAKPVNRPGKWKIVSGKFANGNPATLSHNEDTNEWTDANGNEVPPEQMAGFVPNPKSGLPRLGWGKDAKGYYSVSLDRTTNQEIPGSRNYGQLPPANIVGSIRTGYHFWTDIDGNIHQEPVTTTSGPNRGGASGGAAPTGAPMSEKVPGTNMTSTGPAVQPRPAATSGGGRIIGQTLSKTDQMVQADAIKSAQGVRPQVVLLDTATKYMKAIQSGAEQPNSATDLSLIIQAVRAMNPGTVRLPNLEISLERERGTVEQRVQRWYQRNFGDGTLPDQYRDELYKVIHDETTTNASDAARNWQQAFGDRKPVPTHLQRYVQQGGGGGGKTIKVQGQQYNVNPDGTVNIQGHLYKLQPDGKTLTLVKENGGQK